MPSHDPDPQLSFVWAPRPPHRDAELEQVRAWLLRCDPDGARFGRVLRESLDQVLDGPRTGRFRYSELRKTEKTHVGTVVEINIAKEFDLRDGTEMDYLIDGVEVDCKYSMTLGQWSLPRESMHRLVLLTWADDATSKWSVGLWRVDPDKLNRGNNQDRKKTIDRAGRREIDWLWFDKDLDENLLLHLDPDIVAAIFSLDGRRDGQKRINQLFRLVRGRIVRREVVLTVARQKDGPRRARMAREPGQLGREGIVVLGHYEWDVQIAEQLRLPRPGSGEWVSVRVVPIEADDPRLGFEAAGQRWGVARDDEPVHPAPVVPRGSSLEPSK